MRSLSKKHSETSMMRPTRKRMLSSATLKRKINLKTRMNSALLISPSQKTAMSLAILTKRPNLNRSQITRTRLADSTVDKNIKAKVLANRISKLLITQLISVQKATEVLVALTNL